MHSLRNALAAGVLAVAVAPGAALAKPDLVINVERSEVLSVSCRADQPLAVVRVAVDNIGTDTAGRNTTIGLPAVAGVSAEHAPYTYESVRSANNIDPKEIVTVVVTLGDGVRKAGRIGSSVSGQSSTVSVARTIREQRNLPRALREQLQRELKSEGLYDDSIDGVFGPNTETAIREFQRSRGEAQTGVLTLAQIDDLLAGGPARQTLTGTGGTRRVRFVVIADPDNIVDEDNEGNNVWITEPQVLTDC